MVSPILATKLHLPLSRQGSVRRPHLIARLNQGLDRKLTLISAPAGFGKTTLLSDWTAVDLRRQPGLSVAWLSLDEQDADLTRFLTYLLTAAQAVAPAIQTKLLPLLETAQPGPIDSLLTAFVNELAHSDGRLVLILDDYHLTDSRLIDDAVAFLIAHLPSQMHLVIATREDPGLPLPRLRARGQLTELRAKDLRFQPPEAAEFLREAMGLSLTAEDVAVLEDRTEGWIAGLQLAALSLQTQPDRPGFIRAFAGDHRYILDYLVEEVLERQPEAIRHFLLRTAILDRLNGSLCDAVTGQADGSERLEALERGNFFVIPLDDRRYWYRYHHLFADVLTARLTAEQPDEVPALHLRASAWYAQNGMPSYAIRHALAGRDFERAAALIEGVVPTMRRTRQEATLVGWFRALPEALFHQWPVLSMHYAGALLQTGQMDGVEARLQDAERWLEASGGLEPRPSADRAGLSPENSKDYRLLPGWIALYRAAFVLAANDVDGTVKYAQRALDAMQEEDDLLRGAAEGLLGLAYWRRGELDAAHRANTDCMTSLLKIGYVSDAIGCALMLADIRTEQGRLRDAMRTCERTLQLDEVQRVAALRGTADMHVGMSALYRERNDLDEARRQLQISQDLGELAGLPQNPYRWRVAQARLRETEGDWDGALALLHEADRLFFSDFSPNIRPIPAMITRVWIAQGRVSEALGWARDRGLTADDDLDYVRGFEHMTLARVLLAEYQLDHREASLRDGMRLLARLLNAAEAGERMGSAIEALMLQALGYQMQGDSAAALASLERALRLAAPEGYVRLFVDEGRPMLRLLERAAGQGIAPSFVRQLLTAFGKVEDKAPAQRDLVEPLSERELNVLRLLATELTGPEIANELVISLNTLRTHTRNIYDKLGVHNRQAAILRADELDLLQR